MDPAFRAIADQGLAIVGVVALAVALWWVLRDYVGTLKHDRDAWRTVAQGAVEAIDRLTDELAAKRRG